MRKVVLVGLAIGIIAVVVIVLMSKSGDSKSGDTTAANPGDNGAAHGRRTPSLPASAGSGSQSPVFAERKAAALVELRRAVEQRMIQCPAPPEAMPQDVLVTFHFTFDPRISEPELRRYVVQGTEVGRSTAPISAETKQCIEKLRGTTLNVLVKQQEVPAEAEQIDETFALPLR
jgi:hypothetical protein